MHAVMRTYAGPNAKTLADRLEQRKEDVESLIRTVPGLISWGMMRTGDGCVTFTLCKDKAGCDKSVTIARDWLQKNAADIGAAAPAVVEGPVSMRVAT